MKYETREELLAVPREELTVHERVAQSTLKENPDLTSEHPNSMSLNLREMWLNQC